MTNVNLVSVILLAAGGILIYSAVKDRDPRAVVKEALGQKAPPPDVTKTKPLGDIGGGDFPIERPAIYPNV